MQNPIIAINNTTTEITTATTIPAACDPTIQSTATQFKYMKTHAVINAPFNNQMTNKRKYCSENVCLHIQCYSLFRKRQNIFEIKFDETF
jgi:hypothetical protein